MFNLTVKADDLQFIQFLKKESTALGNDQFIFSHYKVASHVIATFLLFLLKKSYFSKMVSHRRIEDKQKEEFLSYVSVDKNEAIFLLIKQDLMGYFENSNEFTLEGFFNFRLKKPKEKVETMMEEAFENYINASIGSDDIVWFRELLDTTASVCDTLFLHVNEFGYELIFNKQSYLTDTLENDDTMLSHSILLSPTSFVVFDPHHKLKKEMVIMMKKIFLEKVTFYENEFHEHCD